MVGLVRFSYVIGDPETQDIMISKILEEIIDASFAVDGIYSLCLTSCSVTKLILGTWVWQRSEIPFMDKERI